jgi:hypothetical protein
VKIKGPGTTPPTPPEASPDKAGKSDGAAFADRLAGPAASQEPAAAIRTQASDPLAQVSAELRAGTIDARQAVDRLVAMTIDQGPAAHLPPELKQQLRARLEALIAEDPFLAAKAERLK